jgi:hypothetical protein
MLALTTDEAPQADDDDDDDSEAAESREFDEG